MRRLRRLAAGATAALALAGLPAGCGSSSSPAHAGTGTATDTGTTTASRTDTTPSPSAPADDLPPPSKLHATFVGDSVADAVAQTPSARRRLTHGLHMALDLKVCRRVVAASCSFGGSTPSTALEAVRKRGRALGDVLVVDVGYNDGAAGYDDAIDQIVRAAKAQGAKRVVWVTLREAGTYAHIYRVTNGVIARAPRRWPEIHVADWNAYSRGKPWFGADGVHLNPAGADALARFLRPYVTGQR